MIILFNKSKKFLQNLVKIKNKYLIKILVGNAKIESTEKNNLLVNLNCDQLSFKIKLLKLYRICLFLICYWL